jgi:virginiamycin B lyase
MNSKSILWVGLLNALLITLLLLIYQIPHPFAYAAGQPDTGFIHEYDLPAGSPFNIVVETAGPPASVWYTLPDVNALGHLVVTDTADYLAETYTIPTANSQPYDLVYDGLNTIWFTENAGNKIGKFNLTTHAITEYPIPTPNSAPTGIDIAPNGTIWFLERNGNKLGRFNPVTLTFQEYPYETAGAQLEAITVLNDNSIWFTAPALHKVSNFQVMDNDFINVWVISGPGGFTFPPGDIVIGNNQVWISAPLPDWVGIYRPGTLSLWTWIPMLFPDGEPTGLAFSSPDGFMHIWFVETAGNRVGKFVANGQGDVTYHWSTTLPTPASQPRNVAVATNGHAWVTEMGAGKIAEWRPPTEFYQVFLPVIQKP